MKRQKPRQASPQSLYSLAYTYKVETVEGLGEATGNCGETDLQKQIIRIDAKLGPHSRSCTLLHEVIETWVDRGLCHDGLGEPDKGSPERAIDRLALGIMDLIKHNRWLCEEIWKGQKSC